MHAYEIYFYIYQFINELKQKTFGIYIYIYIYIAVFPPIVEDTHMKIEYSEQNKTKRNYITYVI